MRATSSTSGARTGRRCVPPRNGGRQPLRPRGRGAEHARRRSPTSYFAVLASQDRLRIGAARTCAPRCASSTRIRQRREVGTASELDVAQQESVVATQRAVLPTLEQLVLQTKNTLAVLIGRAPEYASVRGGSLSRLPRPAGDAGPAVRAVDAAAGHPRSRGAARRRRCQRLCGARRLPAEHPADRAGRLPEQRAEEPVQPGSRVLLARQRA